MSTTRRDEGPEKLRWPEEIDEIFGRANPNPHREGCPGQDELLALSRRERSPSDPGYVHLTRCSPCYLEVRGFQEARTLEKRRRLLRVALAAAVLLAVGLGLWYALNEMS